MTNKIEIIEEATRTTADRISKQSRRARREFNGTRRHLALDPEIIKELSQEGHLCWVNDDLKGHLAEVEDWGYRYVTNREAYGDRDGLDPNARAMVRFGTATKDNDPQDIYLMLQPWEFYNEDREVMEQANSKIDKRIEDGLDEELKNSKQRRVQYKT